MLAALGFADPLAPFSAQEPGGRAMLALRLVAFALALLCAPRARATAVSASIGALLVASLAARGLLVPLVLASAWVVATSGARRARACGLGALSVVLALGIAASFRRAAPPPVLSAREQVDDWRSRENSFRARAAALEWAKRESPPGDAYLALASIDWELGHRERARKVLSKVIAHPASDDVKRRADDLDRAWARAAP
jgi:hypothetical protein